MHSSFIDALLNRSYVAGDVNECQRARSPVSLGEGNNGVLYVIRIFVLSRLLCPLRYKRHAADTPSRSSVSNLVQNSA